MSIYNSHWIIAVKRERGEKKINAANHDLRLEQHREALSEKFITSGSRLMIRNAQQHFDVILMARASIMRLHLGGPQI